jgi:uncharacterized membrane protein
VTGRAAAVRQALAAATLIGGALLLAASCASVIGVDEYSDAVADMCKCNEQLSFLGSVQDCQTTISRRLDGASEETRAKWLQEFADEDCSACNRALRCFYTPPTCSTGSCGSSEECCGAADGSGYCLDGTCFKEPKNCRATGQGCDNVDQCCGSEAGVARCEDQFGTGRVCIENCAPGAANCPGCCAIIEFTSGSGTTKLPLCGDESKEAQCGSICDPDNPDDACPVQGQSCLPDCVSIAPACLYACQL